MIEDVRTNWIAEYAVLLNKYGPDSEEAKQYLADRDFDPDFVSLARVAYDLKVAFLAEKRRGKSG